MKKSIRILSAILALVLLASAIPFTRVTASANWPSLNGCWEFIAQKTIPVYMDANFSARGTLEPAQNYQAQIDPMDVCHIYAINGNAVLIDYPTSKGVKKGYVKLADVLGCSSPTEQYNSTKKVTTFKTPGGASYGYVAEADTVYVLYQSGDYVCIIYPSNSGNRTHKVGFIKYNDYTSSRKSNEELRDVTASFAGQTISLKSAENGKFLCADTDKKNTPALCNRTSAGDWELFETELTSDGWLGLKAKANSKWLSVRIDNTDAPVKAASNGLQKWECFRIYQKGSDYFILSQANNKYLCVRIDLTNAPVQAIADIPNGWERFQISVVQNESHSNNDNRTEERQIQARLDEIINGFRSIDSNTTMKVGERFVGTGASEQCKGYAKNVFKLCFGIVLGSTNKTEGKNYLLYSTDGITLVGSVTEMEENAVCKLFKNARPGDMVQIRRVKGTPHSAIVYSVSDNDVTFLEANMDYNNGISLNPYTWETLCKKNAAMSLYTAAKYTLK